MTTIYVVGGVGPWSADDELVNADGHQHGFEHATNGPTVDGLSAARRNHLLGNSDDVIKGRVLRETDRSGGVDRR